jgi:RNA polymerase sigma-70 factor (ECF subfamily)
MTTITFEDFFKQHYDAVEAGVRGSGARPDVAAEATQEAFVRAYPRWWRLSRYQNPAAWVQRVAINVRRDLERSDKRRQAIVASIEVDNPATPAVDARVDSAVSSLPTQQQRAIRAYYNEGLSTSEAADQLGISAGAIRFHLSQARASLRPMLATDNQGQEA